MVIKFNAEEPLWCNLDHAPSHPDKMDLFVSVLNKKFKIQIPQRMREELRGDGRENAGNKTIYHAVV